MLLLGCTVILSIAVIAGFEIARDSGGKTICISGDEADHGGATTLSSQIICTRRKYQKITIITNTTKFIKELRRICVDNLSSCYSSDNYQRSKMINSFVEDNASEVILLPQKARKRLVIAENLFHPNYKYAVVGTLFRTSFFLTRVELTAQPLNQVACIYTPESYLYPSTKRDLQYSFSATTAFELCDTIGFTHG